MAIVLGVDNWQVQDMWGEPWGDTLDAVDTDGCATIRSSWDSAYGDEVGLPNAVKPFCTKLHFRILAHNSLEGPRMKAALQADIRSKSGQFNWVHPSPNGDGQNR